LAPVLKVLLNLWLWWAWELKECPINPSEVGGRWSIWVDVITMTRNHLEKTSFLAGILPLLVKRERDPMPTCRLKIPSTLNE
jgi:hypothetical protein